ncbi:28S ribosomal protein S7 [Tropilaelaps mercedesae]|uniref:28S ribosomal protein S7 n=1 Tax=Tropilaelaps mercedesae TaxID=418985 RepID=A0A1V9WYI5_9ACAR|nr:28S ribosomal protein S7 [Tropilaelaps mercedesae]
MAMFTRSTICWSTQLGQFALPVTGVASGQMQFVRGTRYRPSYIEPPAVDPEELKEFVKTPEGIKAEFTPIKAIRSDVSNSVFYDPMLDKFINYLMRKGNKKKATDLVHKALFAIKFIKPPQFEHPLEVLSTAVKNASPVLETTPIKRGGITYQVPVPLVPSRARLLAIRWIIEAAKSKERHVRFRNSLAKELVDAAQNIGKVIRRKQEQHKFAESNKAFAHYRWS